VQEVQPEVFHKPIEETQLDYNPYEENFHGYAFSQENNPNPELSERVRQTTLKRLSTKHLTQH